MDTVFSLLNINTDIIRDFPYQARVVGGTDRVLRENERKLKQIEHAHDSDVGCRMPQHSIDAVVQKVLRNAVNGGDEEFILPELRIVSYNLAQFHGEDKAYSYALGLLRKQWLDLFFNGIASYLLSSWNNIRADYLAKCTGLFCEKLQAYSGNIQRYLKLQEGIDYFKEGGPLRLGALTARRGIALTDTPTVLGYRKSVFPRSYFSDVIVKYVKDANVKNLSFLEDEIFNIHTEDRTKKLVFAYLVIEAEKEGDTDWQRQISTAAHRVLGDISLAATWAPFQGAAGEDIHKLRRAYELVNLWINRRVIETFFEVLCKNNDGKDRKDFWIQYVESVTDFRIAGSSMIRQTLQQNNRIDKQTLDKHFVDTNSTVSTNTALIMVFKGKAIVEFSEIGAVYAYNATNKIVSSILTWRKHIDKIGDLKDTAKPFLVVDQGYGYYLSYNCEEEGKLWHNKGWQSRMRIWLKEMVFGLSKTASETFADVFAAKPISYEKPKITASTAKTQVNPTSLFDGLESRRHKPYTPWVAPDTPFLGLSKWVFDGVCRVVSTQSGFYLHIVRKHIRYAKIKDYRINPAFAGNIWIKKPSSNGWCHVVYVIDNKEINVGFIKQKDDCVLYRESDDHPECKSYPIE